MTYLFGGREIFKFNGDISRWNTSNVTDMNAMFYYSSFNGDLREWKCTEEKMKTTFNESYPKYKEMRRQIEEREVLLDQFSEALNVKKRPAKVL